MSLKQFCDSSKRRSGEASFTLIETVIALGLMVTVIFEISSVQGNAIYFSGYERQLSQATWLAKGVMSKVEYEWNTQEFTEMELKEPEKPFKDLKDSEFTYSVNIAEWKLPLMDLLTGGGKGGEEADPQSDMIRAQVKNILGDELLKIAHVEVFWPEGAAKNSVSLAMLLTNQKAIDEKIMGLQPLKKAVTTKAKPNKVKKPQKPGNKSNDPDSEFDPGEEDGLIPPGGGENPLGDEF